MHTVEEVRTYKPDARAYGLLPAASTLVAAHAWDVLGARSAGLDGIWIDRTERAWPFPGDVPKRVPDLRAAVELL